MKINESKVIDVDGNPDTGNTVPTIPPGFQPMPAMVTVPIIGHIARTQLITTKEKGTGSVCSGECKKPLR